MHAVRLLYNAQQAHKALTDLWAELKPWLVAEHRFEVEIRPERRSSEANAKLHAELTEIAKTMEWAGRKREVEVWKRLMTAAWLRARGESVEILPALDGQGVDVVFRRTSSLTIAEMSELLEFVMAWRAMHVEAAEVPY